MSYTYTGGSGDATPRPLTQFYYGTISPAAPGATIAPGLSTRAVADSVLDGWQAAKRHSQIHRRLGGIEHQECDRHRGHSLLLAICTDSTCGHPRL